MPLLENAALIPLLSVLPNSRRSRSIAKPENYKQKRKTYSSAVVAKSCSTALAAKKIEAAVRNVSQKHGLVV